MGTRSLASDPTRIIHASVILAGDAISFLPTDIASIFNLLHYKVTLEKAQEELFVVLGPITLPALFAVYLMFCETFTGDSPSYADCY